MAQKENGYLLRCFNSSLLDDSLNYDLFTLFLPADGFDKQAFDSLVVDKRKDNINFYFSKQLLHFLNYKAYFLVSAPTRTHIEDKRCEYNKPVTLSDSLYSGTVKYVLKVSDDYFLKIFIDKVEISFCKMKKYTDFENLFKEVIVLNKQPFYRGFLDWEKEKFSNVIPKLIL
jgi:hypothetical protein